MSQSDDSHASEVQPGGLSRRQLLERSALAAGGVVAGASLLDPARLEAALGASSAIPSSKNFYAGKKPQKGGILRYAMPGGSAFDNMDPTKGNVSAHTFYYSYALFDRLWRTTPDKYQIKGMLADEWSHNKAGDIWTVKLKSGVEFHNGKTLSPDDVIYSVLRMLDPKQASARAGQLTLIRRMKKLDKRTVRIWLRQPQVTLPESFAQFIHILPRGFDPAKPVGTGPMKFKSFTPGQQASFLANKNYWGDGPYLDGLTIFNFASPTAVATALQSAQADMGNIAYETTPIFENNKDVHLQSFLVYGFSPIRMRCDSGPTADKRVRQALRYAADRKTMVAQAFAGQGKVANDLFSPQDPDYLNVPQRPYDPERARALLKQAGQEGLTIEFAATDIVPGLVSSATVYAQQAKAAGINVNLNKMDVPTFFGRNYPTYNFATEYRSTASYLLTLAFTEGPTSTQNLMRFNNSEFTALYYRAIGEFDDKKRRSLVRRMQQIEFAEGGMIIWGFNNQLKAYRKVGGIVPDVGALPPHWNELWLSKA